MSIDARFAAFLRRLAAGGVAAAGDLVGCSAAEVARLEATYRVTLPASYRLFLRAMGHASGRLFAHDHVVVRFDDVLRMTGEQAAFRAALPGPGPRAALPPDALVILGRLGEQWLFIRCAGGDDAPVLYHDESGDPPRESHPSVLDWLETWRAEAEDAIRDGYYKDFPGGTR